MKSRANTTRGKGNAGVYEGQALPIVIIFLFVAMILAVFLYSRSLRVRMRTTEEKRSEEAEQSVDSMIALLQAYSREQIISMVETRFVANPSCWNNLDGCCLNKTESADDIKLFFTDVGISLEDYTARDASNTLTQLCFDKEFDFPEGVTIPQDQVLSLMVADINPSCTYNFEFSGNGVVVHKIYAQRDAVGNVTAIMPYQTNSDSANRIRDDMFGICLLGADCSASGYSGDAWEVSTTHSINMTSLVVGSETYHPHEIRLIASPGPIIAKMTKSGASCDAPLFLNIVPKATQSGNFKGASLKIPLYTPAHGIFDYVLYNGTGRLRYVD